MTDPLKKAREALQFVVDDDPAGIPRATSACRRIARAAIAAIDAQPAALTDAEIDRIPFTGFDTNRGHSESEALRMFARAVLVAARAKPAAVPLTDAEIDDAAQAIDDDEAFVAGFERGARWAESRHKDGAAAQGGEHE